MNTRTTDLDPMSSKPSGQPLDLVQLPIVRWMLVFWMTLWFVDVIKDSLAIRLLGQEPNWILILGDATIWWGVWAVLSFAVIHFARSWKPSGKVFWIGGHSLGAAFFALLHLTVAATLYSLRSPQPFAFEDIDGRFRGIFSAYVLFNLFIYAGLVMACAALESAWKLRESRLARARLAQRVAELEASTSKARLEALRRQLNPHFLFNALHAVSGLARHGKNESVVAMLARIADLLRVTLENPDAHEVPLRRELEWLDHYLAVERERFPNRLQVTVDAPDDIRRALIPAMVLQPLVENAIRHGIDGSMAHGEVTITARREADDLMLAVEDNGPGFPTGLRAPTREGVGLSNTRSRLEQLYDGLSSLTIENKPGGGARVTVRVPYHEVPVVPPAESRPAT